MGRYCSITHGAGYLASFSTTLNAPRKAAAEAEADTFVDTKLDGFDTDLWAAATTPAEVRVAADKYASARFLRLHSATQNAAQSPEAAGESLVERLEREAADALDGIAGRGWYRADDGTRVYRREKNRSPRFGDAVR